MPATHFICPDKAQIRIKDCLAECRMADRCMSLPTLRCVGHERALREPVRCSGSQAATGTRQAYLRLKHDYPIDPMSKVFALFGTATHAVLEHKTFNLLSEIYLEHEWMDGTMDLYDAQSKMLLDYKTWGSFKVSKALGLVPYKVPTGEYYQRSGKGYSKGDPKVMTFYKHDPNAVDMWDTELQLNAYRIMLEATGFAVEQMAVEAIVRDGNTHIARSRGIDRPIYHIPIRRMDDEHVVEFFKHKTMALREALEKDKLPDYCTPEERWCGDDGKSRKCNGYCEVAHICQPPWLEKGN